MRTSNHPDVDVRRERIDHAGQIILILIALSLLPMATGLFIATSLMTIRRSLVSYLTSAPMVTRSQFFFGLVYANTVACSI